MDNALTIITGQVPSGFPLAYSVLISWQSLSDKASNKAFKIWDKSTALIISYD